MNIPTTVIGSYPVRLEGAKYAKAYFQGGTSDAVNDSLVEAVESQVKAGIDIVSDGQTRSEFLALYARCFSGVAIQSRPVVYSSIEYIGGENISDQEKAKKLLPEKVKLKGIITGPYTLAKSSVDRHYKSVEKLSRAFAEGLSQEAAKMSTTVDYIQLDEPFLSVDYPEYAQSLVESVFASVKVPKMLHICGDVSGIFPNLAEYKVDYLEHEFAANPRLWDTVSEYSFKQKIGAGVVRSDVNLAESVDEIASNMRIALGHLPSERLVFNPDCGMRNLDPDVAFQKLNNLTCARERVCKEI
jgi:5-methyltetrahydropteroyltriglutamate--homocysteine methyltransferase